MKTKLALMVALVLALGLTCFTTAQAQTKEEAQALVKKALAMAKEKGVEATLKAIGDPKGPFAKGELYIWAGSLEKVVMVAHPYKPKLVGKDLTLFKDVKGKQFFNEFVEVAKKNGSGWVDYYWPKPGAKDPVPKTSYVEAVPGQQLYFGCGVYK